MGLSNLINGLFLGAEISKLAIYLMCWPFVNLVRMSPFSRAMTMEDQILDLGDTTSVPGLAKDICHFSLSRWETELQKKWCDFPKVLTAAQQ